MKRKITKFSFIMSFILLVTLQAHSQKKYIEGYIINNEMQRIEGEVEILDDIFNAQYVNFNDGKILMRYLPDQINSWGIEDSRIFVSRTITEDEYDKQVFLEYIIQGNVNLYTYTTDNQKIKYFVQKGADPVRELKMGRRVNDEGMEVVYQEYLGILRILFDDCEVVKEQIPSTAFKLKDFAKIVKDYNNCVAPNDVVFERKIKGKNLVDIEVLIEYNFPGYSIANKSDEQWNYLEETTCEAKSHLSFGLNLGFSVPKLKGLSIHLGAFYGKWEFDAIYELDLDPPGELEQRIYAYKYSAISIPIMARYTYAFNKFKPFVAVGYSFAIIPKNNMTLTTATYWTDGTIAKGTSTPNILFESRHHGLGAGIGMNYKLLKFADIHFEVRYQQGKSEGFPGDATTPDISYLTLKSNTISILIGLSF